MKRHNKRENELLSRVVERYIFHSTFTTTNPKIEEMRKQLCSIGIYEMWVLTQE